MEKDTVVTKRVDEFLEIFGGLGHVALVEIDIAQLEIGVGPVGLDLGGHLEVPGRLVDLLVRKTDLADVVGQGLVLGRGLDRLGADLGGDREPLLGQDHAALRRSRAAIAAAP